MMTETKVSVDESSYLYIGRRERSLAYKRALKVFFVSGIDGFMMQVSHLASSWLVAEMPDRLNEMFEK